MRNLRLKALSKGLELYCFKPRMFHAALLRTALFNAVTQLFHKVKYFELRMSHATPFWLQNLANIIFDTHSQEEEKLNDW